MEPFVVRRTHFTGAYRRTRRDYARDLNADYVGEDLCLHHRFHDLLGNQATDIIMPDISKYDGLSECRRIVNMAKICYIPFVPHKTAAR